MATVFRVSAGNTNIIGESEVKQGLRALNENEKFLPMTIKLVQMTDSGEELEKVFRVIQRKGGIDHTALMRQISYCINAKRLEEIMASLITGERVDTKALKNGKRVYRVK